jgi:CDP-diacylglycerol--serine O-phosphatidyltransferase
MFLSEYLDHTIKKLKDNTANIATLFNLSLGAFAIIAISTGQPRLALLLIFVAAFTDRLDGMIARRFKIESDFGKQLDSLSDLISFGVAPALLIYNGLYLEYGLPVIFAVILYIICGAVRLARFNVSHNPGYFIGIPITVAGTILTFSYLFIQSSPYGFHLYFTVLLALLMVSPFKVKKM